MYREINVFDYSNQILEKFTPGVFLNTQFEGKINTMVIGWGGLTVIWGRPIFIVLVRDSRATYELIEGSEEFTVSVPLSKSMATEFQVCGTKSLREVDKFDVCNFTAVPGRKVSTPIIGECELHYECKVIYKQTLNQPMLPDPIKKRYYDNRANHTMYFGEVVDQYLYSKE